MSGCSCLSKGLGSNKILMLASLGGQQWGPDLGWGLWGKEVCLQS